MGLFESSRVDYLTGGLGRAVGRADEIGGWLDCEGCEGDEKKIKEEVKKRVNTFIKEIKKAVDDVYKNKDPGVVWVSSVLNRAYDAFSGATSRASSKGNFEKVFGLSGAEYFLRNHEIIKHFCGKFKEMKERLKDAIEFANKCYKEYLLVERILMDVRHGKKDVKKKFKIKSKCIHFSKEYDPNYIRGVKSNREFYDLLEEWWGEYRKEVSKKIVDTRVFTLENDNDEITSVIVTLDRKLSDLPNYGWCKESILALKRLSKFIKEVWEKWLPEKRFEGYN